MRNCTTLIAIALTLTFVGCGTKGAGTYEIDKKMLLEGISKQAMSMPGMTDEMKNQMAEEVKKQAEQMKMELVLAADGTFAMSGDMAGNKMEAKGTWKLEGDKLTMTNTWEDGKDLEEANYDTVVATFKDGKISFTPEGAPFSFTLIRK
ncbi:MAG: hypothetical protein V2A76_02225 [Planctomycetota bacterium]